MDQRFETFTILIASLSRNIRRIKTEEMGKWNLRSNHLSCLYYLYVNKSLTSKQLCDICYEDKANISRSIEFLKENGYMINRIENSQKRYKSPYCLTEKGMQIGKSIHDRVDAVLNEVSCGITEQERLTMYKCLNKINENFKKIN